LQDWLPEGHLAHFVADVMNELDLAAIYAEYERKDGRGLAAYHPLLLTRLLLYGYCTGLTSSRAMEKATHDHVAFRYLAADQHPDHDTIASFRRQHLAALADLFAQALHLCQKAGMVKLGNVAIDGTKMLANASTSRSVPACKLDEREQYWVDTIDRLLAEAERTDKREDEQFGIGNRGDELPPELANAQRRIERIRAAKRELREEAQRLLEEAKLRAETTEARRPGRPRKDEARGAPADSGERERRKTLTRKVRRAEQIAQAPTRQYNFVDPDSRVMRDNAKKCFVQAYNAQAAVDSEHQVIVAAELTQQVTDALQLVPMVHRVIRNTTAIPETITADAGYWDTTSLQDSSLSARGVLAIALLLGLGAWVLLLLIYGVWLHVGAHALAGPLLLNALVTALVTVWVENHLHHPRVDALLGLILGYLVGRMLCLLCLRSSKEVAYGH